MHLPLKNEYSKRLWSFIYYQMSFEKFIIDNLSECHQNRDFFNFKINS